ncbi:MAG: TerB N-terminal domain-containing protein, partial [Alphaproteobacteria bacterium]|nr:TerB N-terminal domain-containing protein [Alphaproteobacteria bacterium]
MAVPTKKNITNNSIAQIENDDLFKIQMINIPLAAKKHLITKPKAIIPANTAQWIKPGEKFTLADVTIEGGMVYVGTKLKGQPAKNAGKNDPSLINPCLQIGDKGDFTQSQYQYHYSTHYAEISPTARRAYLNWLADGKKHPKADICFFLLYFYGLERRVLIDAFRHEDVEAKAELPLLVMEIRRLQETYPEYSASYQLRTIELLEYIEYREPPDRLYAAPFQKVLEARLELPIPIKIALGQLARDGAALPAHLAYNWLKYKPFSSFPTAMKRCPEEFYRLFSHQYHEKYGEGLLLHKNKSKLDYYYRPASSALQADIHRARVGGLSDIDKQRLVIDKIREILDETSKLLHSYSRYIGMHPERENNLEAVVLIPENVWPPWFQQQIQKLHDQVTFGELVLTAADFFARFDRPHMLPDQLQSQNASKNMAKAAKPADAATTPDRGPTRKIWLALAQILAARQIKMLPDILAGERVPKLHEKIVLMGDQTGIVFDTAPPAPTQTAQAHAGKPKPQPKPIVIDERKLAALKHEDQKLAAILSPIFDQDAFDQDAIGEHTATNNQSPPPAAAQHKKNLLGLDDAHAKLAAILLSRPIWSRAEALQQAKKYHLMLDGALERIN